MHASDGASLSNLRMRVTAFFSITRTKLLINEPLRELDEQALDGIAPK